ncbi:MAG TPA: AAA family ATPase [Reyranella sp.]|nr:AAA family ATPase [Reyranella sp.]
MRATKSTEPASRSGRSARPPERRQITVVFCDLIGSTALFGELDPEEVGEVLKAYHKCCADCIEAAGGFVAQFQGDGVIGFFGYTETTESDAERAVRAAIDIVEAVPRLRLSGQTLNTRVGISTGLAVVGDTLREGTRLEQGAVGEVLHVAARLQGLAGANEILVTEATRQLVGRSFLWQDKGIANLKGVARPIAVWRLVRRRPIEGRPGMRRGPVLTPMVNRRSELELLLSAWDKAAAGHGQVLDIVGTAGIGKSRLLHEFRRMIGRREHIWIEAGGAQFFANEPFFVVAQFIRRALDPRGRATSAELVTRLEKALAEAGVQPGRARALLIDLIGEPGSRTNLSVDPEERQQLLSLLADWLIAIARRKPLVIVVEDVHWMDPSSREADRFIAGKIGNAPVLVLRTMRPGVASTGLVLQPLNDMQLQQVISSAGRGAVALTERDVAGILQRAQGIPLFGIELTRLVGVQGELGDEIPATLTDLLAARLDRLGPAKGLAQIASVIGDEISLPLFETVAALPPRRFRSQLQILRQQEILEEDQAYREPVFGFTHALLREAAYGSLLREQRRQLHREVATVLSNRFDDIVGHRPALLAHHWSQSGEHALAWPAWRQAGEFASGRRAFQEAEQAYQAGLAALLALPESPERDANELVLQSGLADALRITRGFSAQQTRNATARASALADKLGDRRQQFVQMWGSWSAVSSAGDYVLASDVAARFHQLALRHGDTGDLAHAHMMLMTSKYRTGQLAEAERYFKEGERHFAAPAFQSRPGVIAQTHGNASLMAWIMGDDAAARARMDHALAIARQNDSPFDRAYAEYMAANLAVLTGEYQAAADLARSSMALSENHNFPQFAAISRIVLGRATAGLGDREAGLRLMEEGLERMRASAQRVSISVYFVWLAEVQLSAGALDRAQASVEEALSVNPQELFFLPEAIRLRGEIALRLDRRAQAEQDFGQALALSQETGARRFAERASAGLELLAGRRAGRQ